MSKRAIILAGGKGARLKPYTVVFPKPLMPVGEYPILEIIIRQLRHFGFDHITLSVNHQAELINAFFGSGKKWNVKIDYSIESSPLSTMGPLKIIKDLPKKFLVMNGDVLTDLNYSNFFEYHEKNKYIFTISSYQRTQISDYGVLESNSNNVLTGFKEKPALDYDVSMGIYAVNRDVLNYIPDNQPFGFDNLMITLLAMKQKVVVKLHNGYWLDIGKHEDYEKAVEIFGKSKNKFLRD